MAELQFPSIFGAFQQGQRAGTEQRLLRQDEQKESAFNKLASLAYGSQGQERQGALGQLAGIDAGKTLELEKGLQGSDDARTKTLVNQAKFLSGIPLEQRAATYQQMLPQIRQIIPNAPDWTPETEGQITQTLQSLVQAYSPRDQLPADQLNFQAMTQNLTPEQVQEARMINLGLRPRAAQRQIIDTGNGYFGVDRTGLNAAPVTIGGQTQDSVPGASRASGPNRGPGSLDINADLQQFASLGIPVTSTRRSPDKNRSVDGVPNSFHLTGEAVDMAPQTPQQRQQARQFWEGKGYQVIDEGDHLHAEPPARGMTVSQLGGGQQLRSAPKPANPLEQERLRLAQEASARADRAEQRAVAGNSVTGKPPTEGERAAAGYLQRMQASEVELEALSNAGYRPNLRDNYTAGEGALLNWAASDNGQVNRQQQEDWVRAKLRKESGAAIPVEEMDREIKTYFPQLGDSEAVLQSKARSRQKAIKQMEIIAGRAEGGSDAPRAQGRGPAAGTVQDGYRFKGGNPADQNSWEKL